ncbi:MAG: alkaline phosphatase [Sphingomonas sp.]|nr:MAG: alkaline phosphatase [Sphingomonas sp.]
MLHGTALAMLLTLCGCATIPPPAGGHSDDARYRADTKNVILFIGDGMGISTVTATRIYDGQSRGLDGESNVLPFERFPNVALVKTYNSNQQVPDSAGTASAIHTGVKTRAGVINIGPSARRTDCAEALSASLPNLGELAVARGKAVGIVTTARITHATPATVYAHSADRDWEHDRAIPDADRRSGCTDIASQLMHFPFAVALGGGTAQFFGKDNNGARLADDADLPGDWVARTRGHYVQTRAELIQAASAPGSLLGVFSPSHMGYTLDRRSGSTEPTLTEMTEVALDRLLKEKNGFYLMVEGGMIDHGHHEGRAAYALADAQEFVRAIQLALSKVDLSNTLILVTADHSHTLTIGGYPTRNNPILGLVVENDARGEPEDHPALAADGQPYTTLGYHNGPGAVVSPRPAPGLEPKDRQQALIPTGDVFGNHRSLSESHGGEDVPLYATGAGSAAVHGVIEQNEIFDIIANALKLQGARSHGQPRKK